MKTKSHDKADKITIGDISNKLFLTEALAFTLADAAASDPEGLDGNYVHQVNGLIGEELRQMRETLELHGLSMSRRKAKESA